MHLCSQWGKGGAWLWALLPISSSAHTFLRPSEALGSSVWISPLWLSHVQGLRPGPFLGGGRGSHSLRNVFER